MSYKYQGEPLTKMLRKKRIMAVYKNQKIRASDITADLIKGHINDGGFYKESNGAVHKETYRALQEMAVLGLATKSDVSPYYLIHDNDESLYDE